MSKTCIFLTSRYPFGYHETFIENEINFLSKNFDNILILSYGSSKKRIRKVPTNVSWESLEVFDIKFKKIRKFIAGLFFKKIIFQKNILKTLYSIYVNGGISIGFKKAKKIILKKQFDVSNCVIYSYWLGEQASIAWELKKYFLSKNNQNNIVAISRAHRCDLYSEYAPLHYLPEQYDSILNLDHIYSCNLVGESYLKRKYPKFAFKISVAYLGTQDFGLGPKKNVSLIHFVTCSNIIPIKRIDLFAKVFCILSEKHDNILWTCIGDGKDKQKINKIIANSKAIEKVTFLGQLSNEEVISFYKNNYVSFFVNTSKIEGLPVSVMEAMSFGIPCIATDVGGTSELVNDENGLLISENFDCFDLADKIESLLLLNDAEIAKKRVASRQTWENNSYSCRNYNDFYANIIKLLYNNKK